MNNLFIHDCVLFAVLLSFYVPILIIIIKIYDKIDKISKHLK